MNGTSIPLVLLHGWGGSFASTFARNGWLDAFSTKPRPIHGIDLPGHGGGGALTPDAYADLAGEVAASLPSGPVDVIGYSLGGKIALAIAAKDPARFRRMVIGGVGNNLFGPEMHGEAVAQALVEGVNDTTPAPVQALVDYSKASESNPLALAAVLRRKPNPLVAAVDLAAINVPLLLVNGSADAIAMPADILVGALPAARLRVLEGIDHIGLPTSHAFCEAARSFLDE